jgi:hypothetical protein
MHCHQSLRFQGQHDNSGVEVGRTVIRVVGLGLAVTECQVFDGVLGFVRNRVAAAPGSARTQPDPCKIFASPPISSATA